MWYVTRSTCCARAIRKAPTAPSRSVSAVRVIYPNHLSESPFRITYPSRLSESSV